MDSFGLAYCGETGGRIDDTAGSEFLWHFQLVAELNAWTEKENGLYLVVSLDGSAMKLLEMLDASREGGYKHLAATLEQ